MNKKRLKGYSFAGSFDDNPMSTVANLVDVMLVFVSGLLVAIIMYWNVNLAEVSMILDSDQIVRLEDESQAASASSYDDLGSAYVDPVTGEIVVIQDIAAQNSE